MVEKVRENYGGGLFWGINFVIFNFLKLDFF